MKIQRKVIIPTLVLSLCVIAGVGYMLSQSLRIQDAQYGALIVDLQNIHQQRTQALQQLSSRQSGDVSLSLATREKDIVKELEKTLKGNPIGLGRLKVYETKSGELERKIIDMVTSFRGNKKDKKLADDLLVAAASAKLLDSQLEELRMDSPGANLVQLFNMDAAALRDEQMIIIAGLMMILVIFLMMHAIIRATLKPLKLFTKQAEEISGGIFSKRIGRLDCVEVDGMAHFFNVLVNRVEHYDDDVKKAVDLKTKSLQFESQRITGIFEGTSDWIAAVDTDFRFIAFNSVYAHEFQRRYGKKIARTMHLLDDAFGEYPKGREKARELWGRALAGEQFSVIEQMGDEGVGIFWYEMSYNPLKDESGKILGASQIVRDVTERRHQEDLIRRAKDRIEEEVQNTKKFQLAVEYSTDAIQIATADMAVVYVNPAWEKLTGYAHADILSQKMTMLHSDRTPLNILESMNIAIAQGNEFHTEELISKRKDGSEFNAELTFFPIRREGKVQLFVGILSDITHRKRLEQAQSEFVSLASHQLRTPLTAVRLAIGALQRGEAGAVSPEAGTMLKRSMEYVVHMAETIHTMLNISRLEAGKLNIIPREIALNEIITEITSDYVLECQRRHQVVEQVCDANLKITTDAPLIKEAISNLFGNAIKYTPDNGKVSIKVESDAQRVRINITDTGYGIPQHQQEKIFTKFFRAENVMKKETSGTGLGLYLVHSIVQLLHGSVSFVSKENEGTTFTIDLPILPPPTV